MYVYANPKTKTCQVVESEDILDAIAISGGIGIIYKTDDPETGEDTSHMTQEEVTQAMDNAIAWKDGILSNLGKSLFDYSKFRNYID
jgi:hypothetical protein